MNRFMSRRFILWVLLFAILHFLVLAVLNSVIFLVSHLPPDFFHLDDLITILVYGKKILVLPRVLLRFLWFSERTPHFLNATLAVLNSLVWGALLTCLKKWRGNL
jgi:hypothetical protein